MRVNISHPFIRSIVWVFLWKAIENKPPFISEEFLLLPRLGGFHFTFSVVPVLFICHSSLICINTHIWCNLHMYLFQLFVFFFFKTVLVRVLFWDFHFVFYILRKQFFSLSTPLSLPLGNVVGLSLSNRHIFGLGFFP